MFLSAICSKLPVAIHDRDVEMLNCAVSAGGDAAALRMLREETTFLVLLVREENDERREKWKARQGQ